MPLPFPSPWLLAPMEGVTDPAFRGLVLGLHGPEHLGGAYTEFVRVTARARKVEEIRRFLGPHDLGAGRGPIPVGVQLMGRDLERLGDSARAAVEAGAAIVDLNFGCPARGALRGCAGAAQLRDPAGLERVVAAVVRAVEGRRPVSAKIRAGYDHARDVEALARAAEAGGAELLTIHCRTRREGYQPEVDWGRIARAVEAVSIPVCGNGGVEAHADLERMRARTGCALVMVGRAALGDPWVFSGRAVSRPEAADFLVRYGEAMAAGGATPKGVGQRLKQLLKVWTAGGVVADEADRRAWLTEPDPLRLVARLRGLAGEPDARPERRGA